MFREHSTPLKNQLFMLTENDIISGMSSRLIALFGGLTGAFWNSICQIKVHPDTFTTARNAFIGTAVAIVVKESYVFGKKKTHQYFKHKKSNHEKKDVNLTVDDDSIDL